MVDTSLQPNKINGLDLWFDLADLTPGTARTLNDLSARGTRATTASSARSGTVVDGGLDLDGDDLYRLPDTDGLNRGPAAARTLTFSLKTAADVKTMQVLYEQGGADSGLSVYVQNSSLYFAVWNFERGSWGIRSVRTDIEPNTRATVSLVYDSVSGAVIGYRDGALFGRASGMGELASSNGDIGLGGVAGRTRDASGKTIYSDAGGWKGSLLEFSSHNRALQSEQIKAMHGSGQDQNTGSSPDKSGFTNLSASYFVTGIKTALSQINFDARPTFSETVTEINRSEDKTGGFWSGGPLDGFAARYVGNFSAAQSGQYAFYLTSDDGSALFIDGVRVIDNDGVHAAMTQSVSTTLAKGAHSLEVRYFEAGGAARLDLDWSGPGFTRMQMAVTESITTPPALNRQPVAADDGPFAATVGDPLRIALTDILRNDMDPDSDSIVFSGLGSVTGGVARVSGDQIVFEAPAAGAATIFYEIHDSRGAVDTATISVDVSAATGGVTADFFVAPQGNNKAAGTVDAPFATIGHAIEMAKPGDVILVRAGVFRDAVTIWKGGADGAPITIKAYPGERPVIDGSATGANTDLVTIGASHVRFEGFEVRGATRSGISVWSASNVELVDNVIHDAVRGGIWVGADRLGVSSDHLIESNVIYNTGLENAARNWSEGWPRALAIDVSTDTVVRKNTVFNNYGEGIGALSSKDLLYKSNIVYDNYSVQMYLDNTQNVTATENVFFHTGNEEFFRYGRPGTGLLIANEYTEFEMPTKGLVVQNNKFVDVTPVYYDGSYGRGGGITGSILSPNEILPFDAIDQGWMYR